MVGKPKAFLLLAFQGRSETPSNQAFEGVKFITIVNFPDIFGIIGCDVITFGTKI